MLQVNGISFICLSRICFFNAVSDWKLSVKQNLHWKPFTDDFDVRFFVFDINLTFISFLIWPFSFFTAFLRFQIMSGEDYPDLKLYYICNSDMIRMPTKRVSMTAMIRMSMIDHNL